MNVVTDLQEIDHQIKQFITALKRSAQTAGQPLSRKGPAILVDKTISISTPLEKPSTPHRVRLVEISADRAAIVTKHYLAMDMLVLLQLTGQHVLPARVSSTKKNRDEHHVELDFVREYDHEVHRLADASETTPKKHTRGLLAWLTN
jgi:hypothetical protein